MIGWYFLIGGTAGFLSGLLGIGGGMIIVPALLFLFTHALNLSANISTHLAIGTSMASIILTTAFATYQHNKRHAVMWAVFGAVIPGVIIGAAVLGPLVASFLSGKILRIIFAVFCLVMAAQIFFSIKSREEQLPVDKPHFFGPSLFIGMLSAILGIAGGSLTAILLNWYRYPMRKIVGTSVAIGVPVAIFGTLGLIIGGLDTQGLPKGASGYVYWPAFVGIVLGSFCTTPLGVYFAHKLRTSVLKKCFALLLVVIAGQMILN